MRAFAVLLLSALTLAAAGREVAITIDDLPRGATADRVASTQFAP